TTKPKNVEETPNAATSCGKEKATTKLAHQSTSVAPPIPRPRTLSGKISESSSQVTGETKPCWKQRKSDMAPSTRYASEGEGWKRSETTPSSRSEEVVPMSPITSMGRLPVRPTSA